MAVAVVGTGVGEATQAGAGVEAGASVPRLVLEVEAGAEVGAGVGGTTMDPRNHSTSPPPSPHAHFLTPHSPLSTTTTTAHTELAMSYSERAVFNAEVAAVQQWWKASASIRPGVPPPDPVSPPGSPLRKGEASLHRAGRRLQARHPPYPVPL